MTTPRRASCSRARCAGSGTKSWRVVTLQERLLEIQQALRHQATHDDLTGLWNRGMTLDHLERELHRASRESRPIAVAIADLDHFKQFNDQHGHAAGDAVLKRAATRMRAVMRDYDAHERTSTSI